jgi:holo-[acyl-carrier protein] synthase
MYVKKNVLGRLEGIVYNMESRSLSKDWRDTNLFTNAELDYCGKRLRCLGARFIIKECVLNYLESELGYVKKNYHEIEIINNEYRKPLLKLFGSIRASARRLNIKNIIISISHSRKWITGMVLFCY